MASRNTRLANFRLTDPNYLAAQNIMDLGSTDDPRAGWVGLISKILRGKMAGDARREGRAAFDTQETARTKRMSDISNALTGTQFTSQTYRQRDDDFAQPTMQDDLTAPTPTFRTAPDLNQAAGLMLGDDETRSAGLTLLSQIRAQDIAEKNAAIRRQQELSDMATKQAYQIALKQIPATGKDKQVADIVKYNLAKKQFLEGNGDPNKFVSLTEFLRIMKGIEYGVAPDVSSGRLIDPPFKKPEPQKIPEVAPSIKKQEELSGKKPEALPEGLTKELIIEDSSDEEPELSKTDPKLIKRLDDQQKTIRRNKQKLIAGQTVTQDLQRALTIVQNEPFLATGVPAEVSKDLPFIGKQTPAGEAKALVESALSNVGLDTLRTMRENSPTGGALGQVPIQQQKRLEQVLGSLDVGQRKEIVEDNLKRVINIYKDLIYGTPQQIEGLIKKGRVKRESVSQYMERYELSFDVMGRPVKKQPLKIKFKKITR